tara:strand:- start:5200 stop:5598 length:399 start_codon:yes stop_codon:yes gene_type:complete
MHRDMYQEHILDLYKEPLNFGDLKDKTEEKRGYNPLCGDDFIMQVKIKNNKIEDIKFKGTGCAISIAASSLLTDHVKGKTVDQVKKIKAEDLIKLMGIEIGPVRMKCALLGLETLHKIVFKKEGEATTEEDE